MFSFSNELSIYRNKLEDSLVKLGIERTKSKLLIKNFKVLIYFFLCRYFFIFFVELFNIYNINLWSFNDYKTYYAEHFKNYLNTYDFENLSEKEKVFLKAFINFVDSNTSRNQLSFKNLLHSELEKAFKEDEESLELFNEQTIAVLITFIVKDFFLNAGKSLASEKFLLQFFNDDKSTFITYSSKIKNLLTKALKETLIKEFKCDGMLFFFPSSNIKFQELLDDLNLPASSTFVFSKPDSNFKKLIIKNFSFFARVIANENASIFNGIKKFIDAGLLDINELNIDLDNGEKFSIKYAMEMNAVILACINNSFLYSINNQVPKLSGPWAHLLRNLYKFITFRLEFNKILKIPVFEDNHYSLLNCIFGIDINFETNTINSMGVLSNFLNLNDLVLIINGDNISILIKPDCLFRYLFTFKQYGISIKYIIKNYLEIFNKFSYMRLDNPLEKNLVLFDSFLSKVSNLLYLGLNSNMFKDMCNLIFKCVIAHLFDDLLSFYLSKRFNRHYYILKNKLSYRGISVESDMWNNFYKPFFKRKIDNFYKYFNLSNTDSKEYIIQVRGKTLNFGPYFDKITFFALFISFLSPTYDLIMLGFIIPSACGGFTSNLSLRNKIIAKIFIFFKSYRFLYFIVFMVASVQKLMESTFYSYLIDLFKFEFGFDHYKESKKLLDRKLFWAVSFETRLKVFKLYLTNSIFNYETWLSILIRFIILTIMPGQTLLGSILNVIIDSIIFLLRIAALFLVFSRIKILNNLSNIMFYNLGNFIYIKSKYGNSRVMI